MRKLISESIKILLSYFLSYTVTQIESLLNILALRKKKILQ